MKTTLELLGRTALIFCFTILLGSICSSIYMTIIKSDPVFNFTGFFFASLVFSSIISIPAFIMLLVGFYFIYKKQEHERKKWRYLFFLWILSSYFPINFSILVFSQESIDKYDLRFLISSLPYAFLSFVFIFSLTYYFDKKKPPFLQKRQGLVDDDILDTPFE